VFHENVMTARAQVSALVMGSIAMEGIKLQDL
jgi:hypothetical protein